VALTPFASHCFGVAFARWLLQHEGDDASNHKHGTNALTICIGRDPRIHGERLADAFARGAESVDGVTKPVRVLYTGVTTTPSMYEFCRAGKCDAAIIITASHLPEDKNGIKFFSGSGGLDKEDIDELIVLAQEEATEWYNTGIMPPSSGNAGVLCSELVSFAFVYVFFLGIAALVVITRLLSLLLTHNTISCLSYNILQRVGQLSAVLQGNVETSNRQRG